MACRSTEHSDRRELRVTQPQMQGMPRDGRDVGSASSRPSRSRVISCQGRSRRGGDSSATWPGPYRGPGHLSCAVLLLLGAALVVDVAGRIGVSAGTVGAVRRLSSRVGLSGVRCLGLAGRVGGVTGPGCVDGAGNVRGVPGSGRVGRGGGAGGCRGWGVAAAATPTPVRASTAAAAAAVSADLSFTGSALSSMGQ